MAKLHRRVSELPYRDLAVRGAREARSEDRSRAPARAPARLEPTALLALVPLLALLALLPAGARADGPPIAPPDDPRVQQLSTWVEQLGAEDEAEREAAFEALTALDAEMLPAIRRRQERMHLGRPERRWAVDILNRFRRHGRSDEDGVPPDLVEGARVELSRSHRPQERGWVVKMAEVAVLWRSLDRLGTVEAQRVAFGLIALDRGLWMPEARNWVRQRGTRLMAAAIHARHGEQANVRRWGRWAMEELGAEDPGRTVQELSEELLPEVLRAYAGLRLQSAMRVIVSYVDHPRRDVRHAARWAMEQYGGNAIWILRTAHRNEVGELPPSEWGWRQVAEAIYAHVDAERMAPVREALEEGIAAREAGDLARMRERFDDVLARAAEVEEPERLADGYAELAADALERGELDDAAWAYRRALRLTPQGPQAAAWRAALRFAETEQLRARGVWDVRAYEALVQADPEHGAAAAVLAAAEPTATVAARAKDRRRWALVAAVALGLLGVGLLWRRREEELPEPTTLDDDLEDLGTAPTFDGFDEADATLDTLADSTLPG